MNALLQREDFLLVLLVVLIAMGAVSIAAVESREDADRYAACVKYHSPKECK